MSTPVAASGGANTLVQAIVGAGDGLSHFYMLALPPLSWLTQAELGVSYAALGLLIKLLDVATGGPQVAAGASSDFRSFSRQLWRDWPGSPLRRLRCCSRCSR